MKREDRAGLPAPASTSPLPEGSRRCARAGCENAVKAGRKFCSSACFGVSRRKRPEHEATVELLDEMQAALDELRDHIKGAS